MSETQRRRIHFLTDVESLDSGYKCNKCGNKTPSEMEMYDHRKGFISRCFRERITEKLGLSGDNDE